MNCAFEQAIVEHCAPTLAGLKPASLFCFCETDLMTIRRLADDWDHSLTSLGIRVRILKERPERNSCIIYVYRPVWLNQLIQNEPNRSFLRQAGYSGSDVDHSLEQLSARFDSDGEFPHEIGIFLGYPLEDVIGFIQNHGQNFTCCGYWKCYGDSTAAQQCFARYRACISTYKKLYGNGTSIIQLVTAA